MRYLQIVTIIVFAISLLFAGWVNERYYSNLNTDYPKITNSVEMLQMSVEDPQETLFEGLCAEDATDGDLTDQIMVASISHFLEPGTVNVKYVVFDSHNNSATINRKVHYSDYKSPVFSLDAAPVYTVGSSLDLLEHIQVEDCLDGDISDHIRVISNMVNNYSVGIYPVLLEVSNSCGDTAQITLWVHYRNTEDSAVVKLHQYVVYVQQGDTFEPQQWLASVTDRNANALDMEKVEVHGNLDTQTPGCYQLSYSYDDGALKGECPITVVVTERQE